MPITDLPDDVLQNIFRHFTVTQDKEQRLRISLVNYQFLRAMNEEVYWRLQHAKRFPWVNAPDHCSLTTLQAVYQYQRFSFQERTGEEVKRTEIGKTNPAFEKLLQLFAVACNGNAQEIITLATEITELQNVSLQDVIENFYNADGHSLLEILARQNRQDIIDHLYSSLITNKNRDTQIKYRQIDATDHGILAYAHSLFELDHETVIEKFKLAADYGFYELCAAIFASASELEFSQQVALVDYAFKRSAEKNYPQLIISLLENPSTTDIVNQKKHNPIVNIAFNIACSRGNTNLVRILLDNEATKKIVFGNCQQTINTSLRAASDKGHFTIVETILSHPEVKMNRPEGIATLQSALANAASNGHSRIAKQLLTTLSGSNVKLTVLYPRSAFDGGLVQALLLAVTNGHSHIVKLFTEHFPKPELYQAILREIQSDGSSRTNRMIKTLLTPEVIALQPEDIQDEMRESLTLAHIPPITAEHSDAPAIPVPSAIKDAVIAELKRYIDSRANLRGDNGFTLTRTSKSHRDICLTSKKVQLALTLVLELEASMPLETLLTKLAEMKTANNKLEKDYNKHYKPLFNSGLLRSLNKIEDTVQKMQRPTMEFTI